MPQSGNEELLPGLGYFKQLTENCCVLAALGIARSPTTLGKSTDTTSEALSTRISPIRPPAALKLHPDLNRDLHTTHRISVSYGRPLASR